MKNLTGPSDPGVAGLAARFPTFRRWSSKTLKTVRKLLPSRRTVSIAVLIGGVLYSSLYIYASLKLNRELEAVRQRGEPLTLTDLTQPAIPDSQNAALLYAQAFKVIQFTDKEDLDLGEHTRLAPYHLLPVDEELLRKNARALALLRQAAALPKCQFPLDVNSDPSRLMFPQYSNLRRSIRLLRGATLQEMQRGDRAATLRDLRLMFCMAKHLSNQPFIIGFLASASMQAVANKALGQTLQQIPLSPAQAHGFEASLPRVDWTASYHGAMLGERVFLIGAFQVFQTNTQIFNPSGGDGSKKIPFISKPLLLLVRPVLMLDIAYSLHSWAEYCRLLTNTPVPYPVSKMPLLAETDSFPFYAVLSRILLPVYSHSRENRDAIEVRERERIVALALDCYRTAHGAYPAQLSQAEKMWGHTLPLDPYRGKAFKYRPSGPDGNFVLYSIGVNRKDDAGEIGRGGDKNRKADDIPWLRSAPQ